MALDPKDVDGYLRQVFGPYEDSTQDAWVEILEGDTRTISEIAPIARRVRNRAIKQYFVKKYKEDSLQRPLGKDGDEGLTLESILSGPTIDEDGEENSDGNVGLYRKMIAFLIDEHVRQRTENMELKRKELELKMERLRLREEWLRFKKERFDAWKRLMEEKGRQKEYRLNLRIRFEREKLEHRKERALLNQRAAEKNQI